MLELHDQNDGNKKNKNKRRVWESSSQERLRYIIKQIQSDLNRTFVGNDCIINTEEGKAVLRRILVSYAIHNQKVGYVQSMNLIAARLLCIMNEEDVFWMLGIFCEKLFPRYNY